MSTEIVSPRYADIDVWDPADILDAMIEGQFAAVAAVRAARRSHRAGGARHRGRGCATAAGWSMRAPARRAGSPRRTAPS